MVPSLRPFPVITDAPWVIDSAFLAAHRIDYVAHDAAPYAAADSTDDVYAALKAAGRFLPTQRTERVSSNDLILRIIRDYDGFVRRNLKRGFSRRDMNVSFLKEKQIQLAEVGSSVDQTLGVIHHRVSARVDKVTDRITGFVGSTEKIFEGFLSMFANNGIGGFVNFFRGSNRGRTSLSPSPSSLSSLSSSSSSSSSSSYLGPFESESNEESRHSRQNQGSGGGNESDLEDSEIFENIMAVYGSNFQGDASPLPSPHLVAASAAASSSAPSASSASSTVSSKSPAASSAVTSIGAAGAASALSAAGHDPEELTLASESSTSGSGSADKSWSHLFAVRW